MFSRTLLHRGLGSQFRRAPSVSFSIPYTRRFFFGSSQRDNADENPATKPEPEKTPQEEKPAAAPEPEPRVSAEEEQQTLELSEKISDLKEKLKMATVDAEQATKRHNHAMEDAAKYAHTKMAKDVLDLSDNLRRVHEAVTSEAMAADVRLAEMVSDVRRLEDSLKKTLTEFGVVEDQPLSKKFDPNFHEAMFELSLPQHEPGTVAHVLQTGWLIHERVLRPARVGVVSK